MALRVRCRQLFTKPYFWLIRFVGLIVPRRLRADWRQEWEAELQWREQQLAQWDKLNWQTKLDLLRRSTSAFWDALWLQPQRWEDEMFQDLRYGVRMLRKHKGFALGTLLALALGIGATTAVFSVVNAVLLRPLPYVEAERLVLLWGKFLKLNIRELRAKEAEYVDYRDQTQSFAEVAAFAPADLNWTGAGVPERIAGARVTANLFTTLQASAMQGRVITAEENQAGRDNAAVISYSFWQRRLGGVAKAVGQTLRLNEKDYTIIGVMPEAFAFPHASFTFAESADVWLPLVLNAERVAQRGGPYAFNVIARLKPSVTLAQAQAEMSALAQKFEREYRGYRGPNNADGGWRITVVPAREQAIGASGRALWILLGAIGLVLLIACANVANLLLVRATVRQKEMAMRVALGASRLRLVRQLLSESLLLAGVGGALGLLLAWWSVKALVALNPSAVPRVAEINLDWRVVLFAVAVSWLTGVIVSLAPAWQATRFDVQRTLQASGASSTRGRHWLRDLLVVAELALALPLLIGAGLLLNSFIRLQRVNPGLNADQVLIGEINLPNTKYREPAQAAAFYDELLKRLTVLPGVTHASLGTLRVLSGAAINDPFSIEGRSMDFSRPNVAGWQRVAPDYFATLGIPLVAGRDFTVNESEPVAIINESLARRYWPNENALGQRLTPGLPRPDNPFSTIIGIVKDIPHRTVETVAEPDYFLPFAREPRRAAQVFVRAQGDPLLLASAIRAQVQSLDREQPVTSFATMKEVIAKTTAPRRFTTLWLGGFALVALLLAALGVAGVIAYAVTQRTREIGLRMALGAQTRDVLRLVLRQGLQLVALGLGLGLLGALALTRLLRGLLFGVAFTDPLTYAMFALLFVIVALLACWVPAWRATKVDPVIALRHE